ncbi:MAG TPA: dihydroorotate dehydrogenase electron transfer subunit [Bacteroidales bacterium]|nr:dihydroorotate dehydrogenase electron transfer subunit [Bacteroidales bacterium]
MKSFILDLELVETKTLNAQYVLMKFHQSSPLPVMKPGQFVQVRVDGSPNTYLRRPISINFVDTQKNQLWLLIQMVGDGTKTLAATPIGHKINMILPLGNQFSKPETSDQVLLIGGGVGVAPLLMLGKEIKEQGLEVSFLLGARSSQDLLELNEFEKYGNVYTTTEDASAGEKGFVTQHSILNLKKFTKIYTCGPKPMMQAVANYARQKDIECEVSLENSMACGIGACLCCVEDTVDGHVCTCTTGPVFNIKKLKW